VRAWDCTGTFEAINFAAVTPAQMATVQTEIQKCRALEEKAFANNGMGGYDCGKEQQMNGVNDFADKGGEFGQFGGEYGFAESSEGKVNTCPAQGAGAPTRAGRLFVDKISDTQYCFPDGTGRCQSFTVTVAGANTYGLPDDVIAIDSWEIDRIDYYPATAVPVKVTYDRGGSLTCVQYYTLEQHSFNGPATFGGAGGGRAPGEAGFIPDACKDASGVPVTAEQCKQICSDPSANCRAESGRGGEIF
jgi:hypothetical protein